MKFFKYAIGTIIGLFLIAVFGIVAVVNFVDPNSFKGAIEEKVAAETGRSLSIDGNIEWGFWPNIRLNMGSVQLDNAPGFGDQPFLKLDEFEFVMATWPLLSRNIKIDVVKLYGAEIYLARNADGIANWDDLVTKDSEDDKKTRSDGVDKLPVIAIGGVDIRDAVFSFRDDTSQQELELNDVNISTGPLELGDPIDLKASLNIKSSRPNIAGDADFSAQVAYNLDEEHYLVQPMALIANLEGPKIPDGKTRLELSGLIDANLGNNTLKVKSLKFSGLDMNLSGDLAIFDLDHDEPGARGSLASNGKDIAMIFKVLESPIADQLAQNPDRAFKLAVNFDADMQAGSVSVPVIQATLLGARIDGQFVASDADTDKPNITGQLKATGPDLPALVALAGQLQRNDEIREVGQKLSGAPGREFSFETAFDADLKSGEVAVSALKGKGLGIVLDGAFMANNINSEQGPINGQLSLSGKNLKSLLVAAGQEDLGDVVQSLSIKAGFSGTIANISFEPFAVSTLLGGKDIPNGPVEMKLVTGATNANLTAETLTVEDLSLSGLGLNLIGNLNAAGIKSEPQIEGDLSIKPFNLRKFMAQLKQELPPMADPKTLTKFSLNTDFEGSKNSVEVKKLAVILDETVLNGSLAVVDLDRQDIIFDINVDKVDADRYLPPSVEKSSDQGKQKKIPATPETAAVGAAEELPIELLQNLKVKGDIRIGELKLADATMQKINVSVQARDGDIQIDPLSTQLYQGLYQGVIRIDAKSSVPKVTFDTNLSGIELRPLLQDLADNDFLGGTANIDMAFMATGATSEAMKQSLNGQAELEVSKGTIRGLTALSKLGQRIGNISDLVSGNLAGVVKSQNTGTAEPKELYFTGLSATVAATDGVLTNDDLKLEAPLIRASGRGTLADLKTNTMDYTTSVTFVATLEGKGGKSLEDLTGLPLPLLKQLKGIPISMRRHGPLDEAKTEIDWATLTAAIPEGKLKDALEAGSTVKKLQEKPEEVIKDKLIERLLGGTKTDESAADAAPGDKTEASKAMPQKKPVMPEDKAKDAAKELLEGLFD